MQQSHHWTDPMGAVDRGGRGGQTPPFFWGGGDIPPSVQVHFMAYYCPLEAQSHQCSAASIKQRKTTV